MQTHLTLNKLQKRKPTISCMTALTMCLRALLWTSGHASEDRFSQSWTKASVSCWWAVRVGDTGILSHSGMKISSRCLKYNLGGLCILSRTIQDVRMLKGVEHSWQYLQTLPHLSHVLRVKRANLPIWICSGQSGCVVLGCEHRLNGCMRGALKPPSWSPCTRKCP